MSKYPNYLKRTICSNLRAEFSDEPNHASNICRKINFPSPLERLGYLKEIESCDDLQIHEDEEEAPYDPADFCSANVKAADSSDLTIHFSRNRNFLTEKSCCFCQKLKSISNEYMAVPEFINVRKPSNIKFSRCNVEEGGPHAVRPSYHKKLHLSEDDWFDNHAIPEYLALASNLKSGNRNGSSFILDANGYSRTKCGCFHCSLNSTEKTSHKEKRCARCGIQIQNNPSALKRKRLLKELTDLSSYMSSSSA